jgi:hypothetical protein
MKDGGRNNRKKWKKQEGSKRVSEEGLERQRKINIFLNIILYRRHSGRAV